MIILVGGEKGGTGKTTIAVNLAALRARAGKDVLLVDTDTQGTASMWAQTRTEELVLPAITTVSKFGRALADEVRKLAPRFDDIVIDAGGRDSIELRQSMLVANLMLVPARPSQFDIHGLAAISKIVGEAKAFNTTLRAVVVINCAPTHATNSDAEQMGELVSEMNDLGLSHAVLKDRMSFRRAARDGKAVAEHLPADERAIFEMQKLYKEVYESELETL